MKYVHIITYLVELEKIVRIIFYYEEIIFSCELEKVKVLYLLLKSYPQIKSIWNHNSLYACIQEAIDYLSSRQ